MANVVLHGALKREFGGPFRLDVATPAEAFRALEANFPGRFFAMIRDGVYKIVRGDRKRGLQLGADELTLRLGDDTQLHVTPIPKGSGRKGGVKAVIGVAILAVAVVASGGTAAGMAGVVAEGTGMAGLGLGVTYGNIALFGLTMALSGISMMLSPQPKATELEDQKQSYLFNGPVNLTEQGGAVPLIYGRVRVGSTTISAGIDTEQVATVATDPVGAISVTNASVTAAGGRTTDGLVITATAASAVTSYRISAITGGQLFKRDGTAIAENGIITLDEGKAGLIFDLSDSGDGAFGSQPASAGSFTVTGLRIDGSVFGTAQASITVPGANSGGDNGG